GVALLSLGWYGAETNWLFLLFGLQALLIGPFRLFQSLLNGANYIFLSNTTYVLGRTFFVCSVFLCFFVSKNTLFNTLILFCISQWFEALGSAFLAKKFLPDLIPAWERLLLPWKTLWNVLTRAFPFFLISLSGQITSRLEPILINLIFRDYQLVAYYDLAWKLSFYFLICCKQVINAFSPKFGHPEQGKHAFFKALRSLCLIATPLFIFAIYHAQILFEAWLKRVHPTVLELFPYLLAAALVNVLQALFSTAMAFRKYQNFVALFLLSRNLLLLYISVTGGIWMGIAGYAQAYIVGVLALDLLFFVPQAMYRLKLQWRAVLFSLTQWIWFPTLMMLLVMTQMPDLPFHSPKLRVILRTAIEVGAYLASGYLFYRWFRQKPPNTTHPQTSASSD
ncbi:MAG: hypothetical protein AAGJ35_00845, partial [Myxococcota bacterium]